MISDPRCGHRLAFWSGTKSKEAVTVKVLLPDNIKIRKPIPGINEYEMVFEPESQPLGSLFIEIVTDEFPIPRNYDS